MKYKTFALLFFVTILISCSSSPSKRMANKKFKESGSTAVFTTKFVTIDKKDITTVTHEKEDGTWQFLSNDHFDNFEDIAKVIGLAQIIELDSTVLEIADMQEGYVARRKFKGDKWIIEEQTDH